MIFYINNFFIIYIIYIFVVKKILTNMARVTKKIKDKNRIKGSKEKLKLFPGGLDAMSFKDCKRRAVSLGMPFPEACSADWGRLQSYILKADTKPDNSLIDKYDDWMDKILEERGYSKDDPMRNYQLRLGFISEDSETKKLKTKRIKGLNKPKSDKPKREKDDNGLWKGTKKSYTFELTDRGYSLERITRRVIKKFPEANPKSIQQWYRASLRKKGIDYKTLEKKQSCQE